MPVEFIPFGDFRPDDLDFESNSLNEAKNVLPLFNSYRLLRGKNVVVSEVEDSPVNGAHAHPLLSSESIQLLRPTSIYNNGFNSTNPTNRWVSLPDEDEELWEQVDESLIDDSDRVLFGGNETSAQDEIIFTLSPGEAPGSTSGHILRYRYKIENTTDTHDIDVSFGDLVSQIVPPDITYNIIPVTTESIVSFELTDTTISFDEDDSSINDSGSGFSTDLKNRWIKVSNASSNEGSFLVIDATTSKLTIHPLVGDAPLTSESAGASITITETDTNGFVDGSIELTPTEAGNIISHDTLGVRIDINELTGDAQYGRPTEDTSISTWRTDAGSSTDLFEAINEESSSDSDYVTSKALQAGEYRKYKVKLSDLIDTYSEQTHTIRYRYRTENAGLDLQVDLVEGTGSEETTIATNTESSITPESWTDGSFTLSTAEIQSIEDYEDLYLVFSAIYSTEVSSTVSQFSRPDNDISIGGWLDNGGGTTNLWEDIDEDSGSPDSIRIFRPKSSVGTGHISDTYKATLSNVTDPKTSSGHVIRGKGRLSDLTQGETLTFQLRQDTTLIASQTLTWGTNESNVVKTFSYTLTASEANSISDYNDLQVWIAASDIDTAAYQVDYFELEIPSQREVKVSWAELETPSAARFELSWLEFELPDPDATIRADQVEIYAGTNTAIYTVSSTAFTDVSKSGGYSSGGNEPHSWDFASWGGAIIGTNYIDPVQILDVGDSLFSDMITSTDKPKARFVAPVREFVVLGDISFSGSIDGTSDEVWWSAIDDASDFDVSVTTQCDRQRLRQTPGQITGLVGGEYGIIFKRNSIIRMDYIGYPEIFIFSTLSIRDGTPYPKSIVPVGNDIYFFSSDGLKVLRDGKQVERVGDQARKLIIDSEFSTEAVAVPGRVSGKVEDGFFFGDYDPNSGLIVWAYRGANDEDRKNSKAIILDTITGRLTRLDDSSNNISAIAGRFNVSTEETSLLRGILGFSWDGSVVEHFKFNSSDTYQAQLTTGIHSFEKSKPISIQRIRPIFRGNPVDTFDPRVEITVTYGPTPLMNSGTQQVTYTKDFSDVHGWYLADLSKSGEFFTIDLVVPSISSKTTKEIDGVQIDYIEDGDY